MAKNETEESILKMLEEKGIIIVQKEWEFVDQLEQLKIKNRGWHYRKAVKSEKSYLPKKESSSIKDIC